MGEFETHFRRFTQARLLISQFCTVTSTYFFNLATLGMIFGALCAYVALNWTLLPGFIVISAVFVVTTISAINTFMIHIGAEPNLKGKMFVEYWRWHAQTKVERRLLASCPQIGYRMGQFRNMKKETALINFEIMIGVTVHMLLLT